MVGTLRIKLNDGETFYGDILSLVNYKISDDRNEELPAYKSEITYDYGIAECYDITEQDEIESIEIYALDCSAFYCEDVSIIKSYYDFNSCCLVIEFK